MLKNNKFEQSYDINATKDSIRILEAIESQLKKQMTSKTRSQLILKSFLNKD